MADFRARQRVQIHDGTDEFGVLSSKPLFSQTRGQYTVGGLDISDEANSSIKVSIVAGSTAGTEFNEDAPATDGDKGTVALVVRKDAIGTNVSADGDYATMLQDANGRLYTQIHDGGNSITVDNPTLSVVGGGTEATALRVTIANDSTGVLSIDDNGGSITVDGTVAATQSGAWTVSITGSVTVVATALDIRPLTLSTDAVQVSANTTANSELNPIYVQVVSGVISGDEIHDFNTTTSVAKDATSNHDHTVSALKTFLLKSIIVAASDAMKIIISVGPVASLVTKATVFTSGGKPTEQIFFDPPIEVPVTGTGTIRVARRNDAHQAMDVYSTIIGTEV